MTKAIVLNYSDAQVAIIVAAVAANDGVADKALAESLASNPAMDHPEKGPRNTRSIIAKLTRMEDVDYVKQGKVTKNGDPVTKKTDLVNRIADLADVSASSLAGLENAPKLALETLARAFA